MNAYFWLGSKFVRGRSWNDSAELILGLPDEQTKFGTEEDVNG